MKKNDFLLLTAVLLTAGALFAAGGLLHTKKGTSVTVTQNGKQVFSGSLWEEKTVRLTGNTVVIADGRVSVTEADCKNQICVGHKPVSLKGESIVCLPNRVIVTVE